MDDPAVVNNSPSSTLISRWDIFCVLLTLSLSCITHPVGSSCGFPQTFKTTVRINPFSTFFDSCHLLREVLLCRSSLRLSWRDAIHLTIVDRLNDNLGADRVVRDKDLNVVRADLRVRFVVVALCILQYTKACGYHGAPIFFSIATMLFVTWIVMEALFCAACVYRDHTPYRPNLSPASPRSKLPLRAGVWSFVLLSVALLAVSPVPVSSILAVFLNLGAQSIIQWHSGVLWLPLKFVSWAPDAFHSFPNPDDSYLKTLLLLYGFMIGFLFLAVLYWILAVAGLGLFLVPLYLAGRIAVPVVLCAVWRSGMWLSLVVVGDRQRNVARLLAGVFVGALMVGLVKLYEPKGTWKEGWTEWMP